MEQQLQDLVNNDERFKAARTAWTRIAEAEKVFGENATRYEMLERGRGFGSQLFTIARTLLRAADERPKKSSARLREFR